jgi:uncharacterized membrane protein YeaQ/YmgE (transglycosylase-associated protein family)
MSASPIIPLGARARLATALLGAVIVLDVVAIGSDIREITLIDKVLAGDFTTASQLISSDDRQAHISVLQLLLLAVTGIAFIRWFHAAYRNVASIKHAELGFKPGWAIGAWFVPILNFWRPKQIADEIWAGNEAEVPAGDETAAPPGETTRLVTLWWALWIASGLVGSFAGRVLFGSDTIEDIRDSAKLDIAALAVEIAAAALAIYVVKHATRRQLEQSERLAGA